MYCYYPYFIKEKLKLRKVWDLPKVTQLVRRIRILTRQASYRAFTSQRTQLQSVVWEGLSRAPRDAAWGVVSYNFYYRGKATLQSPGEDPCYKGGTLALAKDQDFKLVSTPSQLSLVLTVLGESKDE